MALAGLVVLFCSCSTTTTTATTATSGKPVIAAAFYPIEEIVRSVDREAFDIVTLVPPGQEAHEYEPSARQVGDLQKAKFVFYLGDGFQPDVEKAVASLPDTIGKIDLLKSIDLLPVSDVRESLSNAKDPQFARTLWQMTVIGVAFGVVEGVVGLFISYHLNAPPGAMIGLLSAVVFAVVFAITLPRRMPHHHRPLA